MLKTIAPTTPSVRNSTRSTIYKLSYFKAPNALWSDSNLIIIPKDAIAINNLLSAIFNEIEDALVQKEPNSEQRRN